MEQKSIYDEYFALHAQHIQEYGIKTTIVLMQVGVFYEMYGLRNVATQDIKRDDAEPRIVEFGNICELAVVPKSNVFYLNKKYNILMCGFKDDIVDKYVKKMQDAGYTIVLYNQDNKSTATGKKERRQFAVISPGTYCGSCVDEDVLSTTSSSNTICCIWFYVRNMQSSSIQTESNNSHKIYVGMSSVDIYTGKTVMYEFSRTYYPKLNNPNLFDPLDRFLTIYNPIELVVISDNLDLVATNKILKSVNIRNVKKTHSVIICDESNKETEPKNKNISRAKNCEKQIYQREVLSRFYPNMIDTSTDMYMNQFYEHVIATQSFCYLLDFIHQHNASLTKQITKPAFDHVGDNMQLENSSLIQLNILDDGKQINARYASVAKMCSSEALTPMGKRKVIEMILRPTTNISYLKKEYAVVEHMITLNTVPLTKDSVVQWLSEIRDLAKYLRLIYWKRITPKQLYFLYENIQRVKDMYSYFAKDVVMHAYFQEVLPNYSSLLVAAAQITSYLDGVFNIDKCKYVNTAGQAIGNELFILKKNANVELNRNLSALYDSRDQLECCRTFFNELIKGGSTFNSRTVNEVAVDDDDEDDEGNNELANDFGSNKGKNVKINCTATNNYTLSATELRCEEITEHLDELHTSSGSSNIWSTVDIPFTSTASNTESVFSLKNGKERVFSLKKSKNKVSDTIKPIIEFIKTSARSKNKYIKSAQLDECAYTLSHAKKTIAETIRRTYAEILTKLETFDTQITSIIHYVASIDAVLARANMATCNGYCKPNLDLSEGASFVEAKNLRHCIIEKIQTDEIYVANDVTLNAHGILLYGVNAVGKTSLIRSIGIAIIMAQSGFFVSASQFRYKPYTKLFTRILGNDSLAKGLSTFVVEMLELNPILQYADQNSIVLGDELCSGTETPSAISLNMASLMRMCKGNVSFILATHYHELAEMQEIQAISNLSIMHMSMFYDRLDDKLVYNRKLQMGVGSNRYGLEVCKALKMPDDFLEHANELRLKYYATTGAGSILDQKTSAYNSEHVRGMCQQCKKTMSTEVHHVLPQKMADKNGLIQDSFTGTVVHKNHPANLMSVCEKCHLAFHH